MPDEMRGCEGAEVWVVDDHAPSAAAVAEIARGLGCVVQVFRSAEAALAALDQPPKVLLTDVRLPGQDGLALLAAVHTRAPGTAVLVMTAYGSIEQAVRAMQLGALDFLPKPLDVARVETVLRSAVAHAALESELSRLQAESKALPGATGALVFKSATMRAVLDQARRAADSDATVLLLGETGTGKERLARLIHEASPRHKGPFVAAHLAAFAAGVLESELFGHERGAFTGAAARHAGCFEQARAGTLLLDEIAEIDLRTQVKLLRVLQERVLTRVGGTEPVALDTRLVAATHKDLEAEVAEGAFRSDLFYRLDVVRIRVPPLRERPEDVPALLAHFLDHFAARYARPVPELPAAVAAALMDYDWPGNVRELENTAERLTVMQSGRASLDDLPARLSRPRQVPAPALPVGDIDMTAFLEQLEQELIGRALARAHGNKAQAARSLGLTREGLRYKLAKYGLDEPATDSAPVRERA